MHDLFIKKYLTYS